MPTATLPVTTPVTPPPTPPPLTPSTTSSPTPTATATPPPEITPTPVPTDTLPSAEATIRPEGGVLALPDGRVQVRFPPGAVDAPVQAKVQLLPPMDLPADQRLFSRFALDAWPAGRPDVAIPAFSQPVVLTVTYTLTDVDGLLEDSLRLVTWDERQRLWTPISATVNITHNQVLASLMHFSVYALEGEGDTFFLPRLEAGQVSLFTGDSSFRYDLDVPAGVGGLQVPLTLRYSGSTPNSMFGANNTDGGWVGVGWTLDIGSIEDGTITLNGISESLVGQTSDPPSSDCSSPNHPGWSCTLSTRTFYAKNQNFMRFQRTSRTWTKAGGCPGGDASVKNDAFWQAWSRDGTRYEFGKRDYDQMTANSEWPWPEGVAPYSGTSSRTFKVTPGTGSAMAFEYRGFYLDRIVDPHGNSVDIDYVSYASQRPTGESCDAFGNHDWTWKETYPQVIRYTTNTTVTPNDNAAEYRIYFDVGLKGNPPSLAFDRHSNSFMAQTGYILNGVRIEYQPPSGSAIVMREYRFGYDITDTALYKEYRLRWIYQYGLGGYPNNPLPGVQFFYTARPIASGGVEYSRSFLSQVLNGYGATLAITYGHWCYPASPCGGLVDDYMKQVVANESLNPGVGVVASYTYSFSAPGLKTSEDGPPYFHTLVGFGQATQAIGDRRAVTLFNNTTTGGDPTSGDPDDPYKGKTVESQIQNGAGTFIYTRTTNGYVDGRETSWPDRVHFIYANQVTEETCGASGCQSKKTTYAYETGPQGGTQYGNVTTIKEYETASASQPYRTTRRYYHARNDASHYRVDRVRAEHVARGQSWSLTDLLSHTWYYYDYHMDNEQTLGDYGDLTWVQQLEFDEIAGGYRYFNTTDVSYAYDDYGNRRTETTYTDYGRARQQDYDPWDSSFVSPPTAARTTETWYDGHHIFPVTITRPTVGSYTPTETREYYEVNEENYSTGAGLPGQLKRVRDVNNGADTWYQYDAFGRLTKEVRPDDTWELPTVQHTYRDTTAPRHIVAYRETSGSGANLPVTYLYDGLGRVIQTRTESQEASQQSVVNTGYDSLGRKWREYVPRFESFSWEYSGPAGPYTEYTYDALGRAVGVTHPDDTRSATAYDGYTTTTTDANLHFQLDTQDAFGRLVQVQEMDGQFEDDFEDGILDPADWPLQLGATVQTVDGTRAAQLTSSGGTKYLARANTVAPNDAVQARFRSPSAAVVSGLYVDTGTWGQADFRRWGVHISGGTIKALWKTGAAPDQTHNLMSFQADQWYVLRLEVDRGGVFGVEVWPQSNPAGRVRWTNNPAGFGGRQWSPDWQLSSQTGYLDNFGEYATQVTNYGYDILDHLDRVTDAAGNVTTMAYDAFGRKTGMTDRDMGSWSYGYDAAGNLTGQDDPQHPAISFQYDLLNRLTLKDYPTGSDVYYKYDNYKSDAPTTNSWGRLRVMYVGSETSNGQLYEYDSRGRTVKETVKVDGNTYVTPYTYDAMDRVTGTQYPGGSGGQLGETVTTSYNAQGLPATLSGNNPSYAYVTASAYNALGQLNQLSLGNGASATWTYYGESGPPAPNKPLYRV